MQCYSSDVSNGTKPIDLHSCTTTTDSSSNQRPQCNQNAAHNFTQHQIISRTRNVHRIQLPTYEKLQWTRQLLCERLRQLLVAVGSCKPSVGQWHRVSFTCVRLTVCLVLCYAIVRSVTLFPLLCQQLLSINHVAIFAPMFPILRFLAMNHPSPPLVSIFFSFSLKRRHYVKARI